MSKGISFLDWDRKLFSYSFAMQIIWITSHLYQYSTHLLLNQLQYWSKSMGILFQNPNPFEKSTKFFKHHSFKKKKKFLVKKFHIFTFLQSDCTFQASRAVYRLKDPSSRLYGGSMQAQRSKEPLYNLEGGSFRAKNSSTCLESTWLHCNNIGFWHFFSF